MMPNFTLFSEKVNCVLWRNGNSLYYSAKSEKAPRKFFLGSCQGKKPLLTEGSFSPDTPHKIFAVLSPDGKTDNHRSQKKIEENIFGKGKILGDIIGPFQPR
jgi:hypothetical protein